jgi:tRNA-Thr(GGU) m(6)t(6)A37 methyltransferase TsaA
MKAINYKPIGVIHSRFKESTGIPRQAVGASDEKGQIEIFDEFSEGLKDLSGFSHVLVVFHMHIVLKSSLKACPPWDGKEHGVFATRSPYRPNPIGVSVVRLESIEQNILHISGVDMADGTFVLDIKPYIPDLNPTDDIRIGWLTDKVEGMNKSKSGDR